MKTTRICYLFALGAICTFSPGFALADSVSSVTCSTLTAALGTGSGSCSATGLYGYATASVSSSVALPSSAGQAAEIDASASETALLAGIRGITGESTATASTAITINFDTAGPARSGYLELGFSQSAWNAPAFGAATETLTVGSYNMSPNGQSLAATFIPIELGSDFIFSYVDSLITNGDAGTGATAASIGAAISIQAFEADQMTPVELFDPPSVTTPEPGTLGIMATGFAAVMMALRLRGRLGEPDAHKAEKL